MKAFVSEKLAGQQPVAYLCPLCGEWHPYIPKSNGLFDISVVSPLECENSPAECPGLTVGFGYWLDAVSLYFKSPCQAMPFSFSGYFDTEDAEISTDETMISITVPCKTIERELWVPCNNTLICPLGKKTRQVIEKQDGFTLTFLFDKSKYEEILSTSLPKPKPSSSKKDVEATVQQKIVDVSTDNTSNKNVLLEHESAVRVEKQKSNLNEQTPNNSPVFNMYVEYGLSKDENLVSTLRGIAVKNGSSWCTYDKKKKEIVDLGTMQLENFPIFIVPSTKTKEGDLIKDCGEYYFVLETCAEGVEAVNARTGETKFIVPIRSIFGFSCFSRIIALFDVNSAGEKFGEEELMTMYSTLIQHGGATEQLALLLPLMAIYKEGTDNIRKNVILVTSLIHEKLGGNINPMLNYIWAKKLAEKEEI